jgi:hypothetical protein
VIVINKHSPLEGTRSSHRDYRKEKLKMKESSKIENGNEAKDTKGVIRREYSP